MRGGRIKIPGPSSARQRRWRADDGPTLNVGLVRSFVIFKGIKTSIAKKPFIFVIFQGGPDPLSPPPPPDPRMLFLTVYSSSQVWQ